ncbi:hypothetical protein [Maridesulfovibrio sp.]|uniref:hypothetical protein n=1 Tax=Maridesulfovibrio sp. TaxID=2795000 RepID=UPI002A18DD9B|nr:hypothetical protein [Maridesulfovibrio sp.]
MPNFKGMKLTRHGMELLGLVGTGTVLDFTRVAVGSGLWTAGQQDAPAELTGLVREEMSLDIGSVVPTSVPDTDEPAGCYTIHSMLTNAGLASGFALREIGIFATHPTRGEVLYAVDYAGEQYDYIPSLPAGAAPLEKQFRIDVVTGNAEEITIQQSPVLLATHDDMSDHNEDPEAHPDLLARMATGIPEILNPADGAADVGETPIYRFREFTPVFAGTSEEAIQVQVDLDSGTFATSVHDSGFLTTIANGYEQPAGMLQPGRRYKARCRRRLNNGLISPWSEVVFFETRAVFNYVQRPANVSPANGATGVMECPTLVSGPFAVVGDTADTHEATQYRMRIGDVVLHLSPELGAVTEYDFPAGLLLVSGDYVWEVRYKGTALGWSEWSTATGFHTAAAFVTGDEAISFTSWDGYDNASSAGIALADGAALRSNGVDQGEGEGDWVSLQSRAKVRSPKEWIVDPVTSAESIVLISDKEAELADGSTLWVNSGSGGTALTAVVAAVVAQAVSGTAGVSLIQGVQLPYNILAGTTYEATWDTPVDVYGFSAGCLPAAPDAVVYVWDNSGTWMLPSYDGNGLILGYGIRGTFSAPMSITGIKVVNNGSQISSGYLTLIVASEWTNTCTSITPVLAVAPDRVVSPVSLTAATGAATTAFTAEDFNELAVESATLGTDTDTDRPDFILVESAKITPAEAFRRVALGVSGLSKDSETRIAETQCDTWKTGA